MPTDPTHKYASSHANISRFKTVVIRHIPTQNNYNEITPPSSNNPPSVQDSDQLIKAVCDQYIGHNKIWTLAEEVLKNHYGLSLHRNYIRYRYNNFLAPGLSTNDLTEKEEQFVLKRYFAEGVIVVKIVEEMENRSEVIIRNCLDRGVRRAFKRLDKLLNWKQDLFEKLTKQRKKRGVALLNYFRKEINIINDQNRYTCTLIYLLAVYSLPALRKVINQRLACILEQRLQQIYFEIKQLAPKKIRKARTKIS